MAQKYAGGRLQLSLRMLLYNVSTGIWAPGWIAVGGHTKVTTDAASPTTVKLMNNTLNDGFTLNEVRAQMTMVEMSNVMQVELNDPTVFTAALARNGLLEVKSVASGAQVDLERFAPAAGEYLSVDLYHRNITDLVITRKDGSTATAWQATTAYTLGAYKIPAVANGHFYKVTVAGTSGSSAPTWPTDGSTVVDGSVTWQDMGTIIAVEGVDYEINSAADGEIAIPDKIRLVPRETLLLSYSYAANDFNIVRPNTKTDFYAAVKIDKLNTFRTRIRSTEYWPFCHIVGTTTPEQSLASDMIWGLTITADKPDLLTHPYLPSDWAAGEVAREITRGA